MSPHSRLFVSVYTVFPRVAAPPPPLFITHVQYSPEQAPPVKASSYVLDMLAFTGGACSREYSTYYVRTVHVRTSG